MLSFDPSGYSMRWYDSLLTFGMSNPDAPRDMSWWSDAWHNAKWINAAKSRSSSGCFDHRRDLSGHAGRAWPVAPGNALSAHHHGGADLAHDRADHHYRDGDVLLYSNPASR